MAESFFEQPILNSPYDYPARHWELDADGQPTHRIIEQRRAAEFITPIPKPQRRRSKDLGRAHAQQLTFIPEEGFAERDEQGAETGQRYGPTQFIADVRQQVDRWRELPDPADWQVTPESARLLHHWRSHPFHSLRPFFCQIEAVETAIWLAEVAPKLGKRSDFFPSYLRAANEASNPGLFRVALKLATGAGKTTVMAMLIAWQTINAVRHPTSSRYTRGFLIIAPGITIRDRLRVLMPNDPDSYYASRELVPPDLLPDLARAKIVITNYHAFKLRERLPLSAGNRALLQGRGPALETQESEGQMLQRVMPALMGMKNVLVLNDEAHHCYRERPQNEEVDDLKGDEKKEAEENNEAARLWISGIETVQRKLGVRAIYDLSATPFFLRGSGWTEGTLFPWAVSDFSLMDAIECGIVKLPRVPVADNVPGGDMPKFRNLWETIRTQMPKKGRGKRTADPLSLPAPLITALDALYGHYQKTFTAWQEAEIPVPPVFIIVCNNTATSKLVYDYISGFYQTAREEGGPEPFKEGHLPLFRNFDEHGSRYPYPRTLLIDSVQLESGDALDKDFRAMASDEIERFRREIVERSGNAVDGESISDQDLLREVMNTVGKVGRLGEQVRCVVSVSMLTEGWDANSVTHILGVRAFGTQLLCEQVVGRALRRQSYDLNEAGLFSVEYADILGIPFDFTAQPVVVPPPARPRSAVTVQAVLPEREALEIQFPRVEGYRLELPDEELAAQFTDNSRLRLTPDMVGPTQTHNRGIIGEGVDLTLAHLDEVRPSQLLMNLTKHLLYRQFRDPNGEPKLHLFGQLKRITRQWLEGGYLDCVGGTKPAQLLYYDLAEQACERIKQAIVPKDGTRDGLIRAVLDPYNPVGSSRHVRFTTTKTTLWQADPRRCQLNWVVCDSDWEAELCRLLERDPRVRAYVKNQGLGFEVPYLDGSTPRRYIPDFIVRLDDGQPDPLNLIVEVKGQRDESDRIKAATLQSQWLPGVNALGTFGRWAFMELRDVFEFEDKMNGGV